MTDSVGAPPARQVRALFDDHTLTVYQAYSPEIATPAAKAGTFVPPFRRARMTWIKPSFLWMMYRCGWATKPGQERVLAIRITRAGFESALAQASLSHFDASVHSSYDDWSARKDKSPVRVQWDPERALDLTPQAWRSIQIGLGGHVVRDYVDKWICGIDDVTDVAQHIGSLVADGRLDEARRSLPVESPYRLPASTARLLGAD